MRRQWIFGLLAMLAACERAPTALDLSGERLMVHSVQLAGRDVVQVLVQRVSPRANPDPETPGFVDVRPVSGALVEMRIDGEVVALEEAPAGLPPCASEFFYPVPQPEPIGPGCYAARIPGGLEVGSRVELVVRVDGVVVASGEAVVPDRPRLSSPLPGERYDVIMGATFGDQPVPGILLRYELPPRLAGLRTSFAFDSVFVEEGRVAAATCGYDQFGNLPHWREAAVDSLVFVPRGLYCLRPTAQGGMETFLPDSIFGRLSLAGFDSTYMMYDQAARQQSAGLPALQAGVEGALGLFAGASLTRIPVVLLPVGEVR